ncbi:zinc-ribbon domain-containing protein [Catenulispora sp. NL8]|uniref:Zinc-ribbon domain-containing protein n=1 Tax=Catenulispora pinistramenti TaxID=2705254 RepID=A0ABS5KUF0_9ACTN|nr:zinc-ribbon domain-containing protein [Catenulispora pinistramenti]MBS2549619.1 zinc-ribbon domain-containing protein [Catenulispora pinistramenti]
MAITHRADDLPSALLGMSRADRYERQKAHWQERTRAWRAEMLPVLAELRAQIARIESGSAALREEIVATVRGLADPRVAKVADVPSLLAQWADAEDPRRVGLRDAKARDWKCTVEASHGTWPAPPKDRSRADRPSMCPRCTGAAPSTGELPAYERSVAAVAPLAAELDPSSGTRESISYGSNELVRWRHVVPAVCPTTGVWYFATHVWEQTPKSRTGLRTKADGTVTGVNGCRICNSDEADASNCLRSWYPELAQQWISAPGGRTPDNTPVGSKIDVEWTCLEPEHPTWTAPPNRRTAKALRSGCPRCSKNISDKQVALFHELRTHLPALELEAPMLVPPLPGERYNVVRVDMWDETIALVVEFDGWRTHGPAAWRDRSEYDRRKTQRLTAAGQTVIRVREDADVLGSNDVRVGSGWSAWKVALAVLKRIHQLGLHELPGLAEYAARGSDAAAADTEAALLGTPYVPRRATKPPRAPKPRELKVLPPHTDSLLTPIGPPYENPIPRRGALRNYECGCPNKTRVIGAVQIDVHRGNTNSCGCKAQATKRRKRSGQGRPPAKRVRHWAANVGVDAGSTGAVSARVVASYRLDVAGRRDLLGEDNLIPESAVFQWFDEAGKAKLSRERMPSDSWLDYAEAMLEQQPEQPDL